MMYAQPDATSALVHKQHAEKIAVEFVNSKFNMVFGSTSEDIVQNPSDWFLKKVFYPIQKEKLLSLEETQAYNLTTLANGSNSKRICLMELLGIDFKVDSENFYMIKSLKSKHLTDDNI